MIYRTKSELKIYKELFESWPIPINFAGAHHKVEVEGAEIWGHIDSNGICQKVETRTKDGVVFQSTK